MISHKILRITLMPQWAWQEDEPQIMALDLNRWKYSRTDHGILIRPRDYTAHVRAEMNKGEQQITQNKLIPWHRIALIEHLASMPQDHGTQ